MRSSEVSWLLLTGNTKARQRYCGPALRRSWHSHLQPAGGIDVIFTDEISSICTELEVIWQDQVVDLPRLDSMGSNNVCGGCGTTHRTWRARGARVGVRQGGA